MRYREYIWGARESSHRKVFECLGLFCFLVVTYAIYLAMHLRMVHAGPDQLDSLIGPLTNFA